MIATLDFMRDAFCRFANLFTPELPPPQLALCHTHSKLGDFRCRWETDGGARRAVDCRIRLSDLFNMPEEELEDTFLHEMIHYAIALQGVRDTGPHGRLFRKTMNALNERHGRHITVSRRGKRGSGSGDLRMVCGKAHDRYIAVAKLKDGKTHICVCAPSYVFRLDDALRGWDIVESWKWYFVRNSFFNIYPLVRTPKLFGISEANLRDELLEHPSTLELEMRGKDGGRELTVKAEA